MYKLKALINKLASKYRREVLGGGVPDFLIVGAQKCGTTSLFEYLAAREGFSGAAPKEVHYFDREDNFSKGSNWYEKHFLKSTVRKGLRFEASPTYLCRGKVPARLKEYKPDLKIIIVLRDPVSRAYSAWNMYRQWSEEGFVPWAIANDEYGRDESPLFRTFFKQGCPSFSEYLQIELDLIDSGDSEDEPSLLRRGLYKEQIERYVDLFGWDNILIIGFGEIKNNSEEVVRRCHEFLGVAYMKPADMSDSAEIKNKREYPSEISGSDFALLNDFYEKANDELFDYLGFRPNW